MITLLVATSREPELLALCLEGLRWSDLAGVRPVVVVNDSEGDNATPATLALTAGLDWPEVFLYRGPRAPHSNGLGAALHAACLAFPADRYVKIDADMFPLRRDWLQTLVGATDGAEQDLGTGLANVNGTSAPRFLAGLGVGPWPELDGERLRYSDVDLQARLWRLTLERWNDVVRWGSIRIADASARAPSPRLGGFTEVRRRADEYLVNANVVTWSHAWFERRAAADWLLRGEDELVINIHHEGDQPTIAVVPDVLLLHWGYSGCKHLIDPLFPDVVARLRTLWRSDANRLYSGPR